MNRYMFTHLTLKHSIQGQLQSAKVHLVNFDLGPDMIWDPSSNLDKVGQSNIFLDSFIIVSPAFMMRGI